MHKTKRGKHLRFWYCALIITCGACLVPITLWGQALPPTPRLQDEKPTSAPIVAFNASTVPGQEDQTITGLKAGWNLVSFAVLPADTSPASILQSLQTISGTPVALQDVLMAIWCYDAGQKKWLTWIPGSPLNSVAEGAIAKIEYNRGYWLKFKTGVPEMKLTVTGTPVANGRIELYPGWNLVGFDGASKADNFIADLEAIFGEAIDTVNPASSRVRKVYLFTGEGQTPLVWDPENDRPTNDTTQGLPPGNESGQVTLDSITNMARGAGYWVFISEGNPVVLQPVLRTIMPADTDVTPTGDFPGPGDVDLDGDGVVDAATWTAPATETNNVQQSVVFPAEAVDRVFQVRNASNGILNWKIEQDEGTASWLTITPSSGKLLQGTASVTVSVNRGALAGPTTLSGGLTITSSGGSRYMPVVALVPDITGDYRGMAQMTQVDGKQIDMPSIDLFVSLERAPDGSLRGLISAQDTLAIPQDIPLAGANIMPGRADFALAGSYRMAGKGRDTYDVNDFNPLPGELRRELRLSGMKTKETILEGDLLDTVHGITTRPVSVSGRFRLERLSLEPTRGQGDLVIWDTVGGSIPDIQTKRYMIQVPTRTLVENVRVELDIRHPRPSDLEIWLEAPAQGGNPSIRVKLFNRNVEGPNLSGSWPDKRYPADGADAMNKFRGIIGQGTWVLEIKDNVAGPTGTQSLTNWKLGVYGPTVYSVTGTVVSAGAPVAGASVAVTGGVLVANAVTGADGKFLFDLLTRNLYQMTATRLGYADAGSSVFLDQNLTGVNLVMTPLKPETAELQYWPRDCVAPAAVRVIYTTKANPPPNNIRFEAQRYKFGGSGQPVIDGSPIGITTGVTGEVVFTNLEAGIYSLKAIPNQEATLEAPLAVTVRPTAALASPDAVGFRLAGLFGVGGGVDPQVFSTSQGTRPYFISNLHLNANMVDAATFDLDRLKSDGPFPFKPSDPNDLKLYVDTDVVYVKPIPPTHLSVNGVGYLSYELLKGESGGDGQYISPEIQEGQTWGLYRMTCAIGAPISGLSQGGGLSLVGGARPFGPDWTPKGGGQ